MPEPRGCFLQFAKAARPGRAKTRLQPAIGDAGACEVARALTRHAALALEARPEGWEAWLCVDDPDDPELRALAGFLGRTLVAQGEGALGERMHRACAAALRHWPAVILTGSDCTGYDPAYLRRAVEALEGGAEAVLGPAVDGGYVLVGFRRLPAGVMSGIAWGCAAVADAQRQRFRAAGLRWAELPPRADIDRPEDLWLAARAGLRRW